MELIIQLIAGAIGGNAAGAMLKDKSLGTLGNSIAGVLGGGIGGHIIGMLTSAAGTGSLDISSILQSVVSGGAGGGVLMVIVGIVKKAMAK